MVSNLVLVQLMQFFVLQALINRTLRRKKRLYCCFVDYQKAFDFIDRTSLWTKLIKLGIHGKVFGIIKSLYKNVKSCIKHNGFLTQHFATTSRLLQGEIMSPILFSLYVNDFEAKSRKYQGVFEVKSRVKTWQVRGIWSQQLEHKQVPQWGTEPGVRKGKRSLLACHTRCKCSMETTHNRGRSSSV